MQISDMDSVMQIKNAENWNQTIEDWQFLMNSNPELCLVAVFEDQVIGTVTAINYQNKVAWIGMMIISKGFRGLGVSKILLNRIIEKLKDCKSIKLDATPAGVPVYEKLGFIEEYEISRMVSIGSKYIDYQNEDISKISQILENDIPNIAHLDEMLFGANRLRLFQYLYKDNQNSSFQIRKNDQLLGYVFGRKGSNYFQVGPVMSKSTYFAKFLLMNVLIKLKEQPMVIDVLLDKSELIDWLISIGFKHQRNFTRMYLKSNNHIGNIENQFLISGPELG